MADFLQFPSTIWTTIQSAKAGDRDALSRIFTGYRPAVVRFIRGEGFTEADAEDIGQEVFSIICSERFLAKVDAAKGRFRSLVLAVTKNLVLLQKRRRAAIKRGGGQMTVSVDEIRKEGMEFDVADTQERDLRDPKFDAYWIQTLVARAMKSLRDECSERQTPFYEALDLYISGKSYEDVGRALKVREDQVRSYIHQARTKLKKHVEALVREYAASLDEYEKEVDYLWKLIRK